MTVRFATQQEISNWNEYIIANPDGGNMFASYEFAMQKQEFGGYKAHFLFVDDLAITALEKNVPFFGKLWYLPKGPGVISAKSLFETLKHLTPFAKAKGVFAVRIESELNRKHQPTLSRHGMNQARPIIPNPSTITLDISNSLDDIMTNLPQKGRHAIRRAERDGVTVKQVEATDKNCEKMYKLLSETAEGQFGIRKYSYYKSFWQRFETAKLGQLFFAYYEGKVVAGAYAIVYGEKSTYKDGASIRKRTAYGASHLLQWHVIKWAKTHDAKLHDFCGSPPTEEINNPNHKHYGVGRFKLSFSKNVIDYIGCYDWIIDPARYKIWDNFLERIVKSLYYRKYHDIYF